MRVRTMGSIKLQGFEVKEIGHKMGAFSERLARIANGYDGGELPVVGEHTCLPYLIEQVEEILHAFLREVLKSTNRYVV